ncbi:MAG: hypothetical protein LBR74_02590, partial [Eubacterium sp.]|nr:hypothetical protein [Eubacterium sp.]
MWQVLFAMTNDEPRVIDYLQKYFQRQNIDIPYKLFFPTRRLSHFYRGKMTEVSRPLFPGYIFMESNDPLYFKRALRGSSKFLTVLCDGDRSFDTMRQDEIDAIRMLLNQYDEIEFSSGLVEKDRVRVVSGPLKNYCGSILKINRRECKAKIQLTFKGKPMYTHVGL